VRTGRPLYDTASDGELFVAPEAWKPTMRALDRGLNLMVTGGRGSGKTSLLRQLQRELREQDTAVGFVDATAGVSAGELAERIRDALAGRPAPIAESVAALRTALPNQSPPPGGRASEALHGYLAALERLPKTVVLVDASGSAEAVYGVFGRLRDVVWQLDHTWVVAVDEHERAMALKPPADAFFDVVVALEPMSTEALMRLLALRDSETPTRTRSAIAAAAAGNPRAALRALNDAAIHDRDALGDLEGRAPLVDAASRLGRPHGLLMVELLDRGQASPSDGALQASLGVSRARLTALLRDLLEQGMVEAGAERRNGPGRPRTVYRPVGGGG
jgi:hypothetical protein